MRSVFLSRVLEGNLSEAEVRGAFDAWQAQDGGDWNRLQGIEFKGRIFPDQQTAVEFIKGAKPSALPWRCASKIAAPRC